jgi:hypothetical protein
LTILGQLRLDAELTYIPHGFNSIEHEIHQYLLQLNSIGHHRGEPCGDVGMYHYRMSIGFVLQHTHHLPNDFVYVDCVQL